MRKDSIWPSLFDLVIGFVVASAGCVPVGEATLYWVAYPSTQLEGVTRDIRTGDVITSSVPLDVVSVATLDGPAIGESTHRGRKVYAEIPSGPYELVAEDASARFFGSTASFPVRIGGGDQPGFGGILIDKNSGASAVWWSWRDLHYGSSIDPIVYVAPTTNVPPITLAEVVRAPRDSRGAATLSYGGLANGQIKFLYREFVDEKSGIMSSDTVALDYAPETKYAYKNALLVVHEATPVSLRFTLITPL